MYKHRHTFKKYKGRKHKKTKTRHVPKTRSMWSKLKHVFNLNTSARNTSTRNTSTRNIRNKFYKGGDTSYTIQPQYTAYKDGGANNDIHVKMMETSIQAKTYASTD